MSSYLVFNAKMSITTTICENLLALRSQTKLSQTAFAEHCKIHQKTYQRIEKGDSVASLEILEKIAKKNDLEVWQLLVKKFNPGNAPVLMVPSLKEKVFYEKDAATKTKREVKKKEEIPQ